MIHNAMNDEDSLCPFNFAAVGSILLEFVDALSDYMGWTSMFEAALQNDELIFYRKKKRNGTREFIVAKDFAASDVRVKQEGLSLIWGRFLSHIDRGCTGSEQLLPEFDINKVCGFTKSFFDNVEKSHYIFFIEVDNDSTSSLRSP